MKLFDCRLIESVAAIFWKDFLIGLRRPATFAAMMMFALTSMAGLSLAMRGAGLEPNFSAALLWIVIFFAAGSGISGTFDDESAAGTLPTLKIYALPQAVLFGKIFFVLAALASLTIFIVPIFLILFDCEIFKPGLLIVTIFFGIIGFAASGTLTAALTTSATVKGGLFPILLFPITLPIFLPAIQLTETAFTNSATDTGFLIVMLIYDSILILSASILYDYLD